MSSSDQPLPMGEPAWLRKLDPITYTFAVMGGVFLFSVAVVVGAIALALCCPFIGLIALVTRRRRNLTTQAPDLVGEPE